MKIASVESEADPGASLVHYLAALEGMNRLPEDVRHSISNRRALAMILRKYGLALKEVGNYREAITNIEDARAILSPLLVADPNDTRAGNDMLAVAENEAECFEDRAERVFNESGADPKLDAADALRSLAEALSIDERLLKSQPDNAYWRSTQGYLLVRMSLQASALKQSQRARGLALRGVAILKEVATRKDGKGFDQDSAATGLTIVRPVQLREPELAVKCAERIVETSHRQKPAYLLTLARAYDAAGAREKAKAAEGLKLLPSPTATTILCRVRKQLQAELAK